MAELFSRHSLPRFPWPSTHCPAEIRGPSSSVLPGTMGQDEHAAPAPPGCQESPGQHQRAREGQAAPGHGSKHELWLQALQVRCPEGPQAPQGRGSPQVSLCHTSLCPLQPSCACKAPPSPGPACPCSGLSFGSTQGAGTPECGLAPLPVPIPARQSGCHGQVFCKRRISAAPGIVPGRGGQGWALPAVGEGGLAGGQCLALGELLGVGKVECAWPWGREGAGLRTCLHPAQVLPRK